MHDTSNHLSRETSPYLLQHAHNPVDWYPWGDEALTKARRENKPILLSIGYSACHWCHVMAHESFEDETTTRIMNELFVNIKVDREERPDLDKIYQTAYQLLNQRGGGWPLTMFLTPDDQIPFFGATYVPKESRYGMPAFTDLMRQLIAYYQANEDKVRRQNTSLMAALEINLSSQPQTDSTLSPAPFQAVRTQLEQSFDATHGGFGQAPKFPHPTNIERLLRHWSHTISMGEPDEQAKSMACFTLSKMASGGIYDQLGGGFCRYSVDQRWMIPHFEKMLYDNGPLLTLYSETWQATGVPLFQRIAEETGCWVIREMQSPEGGYYSTLDADSEGEEGKFYVWTPEQIKALLSPEEYAVFAPRFGLDRPTNFEDRLWHLHIFADIETVAKKADMDLPQLETLLTSAREKLFAAREQRQRPERDEKILTAWNGLMIKGMAAAGRRLGRADFLNSATQALDFIRARLWRDGRLLATYKDDQARFPAYLDDYAFLLDGLLELLQARWRDGDLEFALALADVLLAHFQDSDGGFYFTADDHEKLIQRPKPAFDDALPAGNGIAAQVLLKLGHLVSSMHYLTAAERTLRWAWPFIEQAPMACGALLLALEEYSYPSQTIIIRGHGAELAAWRERCARPYAPRRLILAIPADAADLPGILRERGMADSNPVAYVCSGTQCSPPITALDALEAELIKLESAFA